VTTATEIVLYSRPGCHLCDDTHATLNELLARRASQGLPAPTLVERNIEDDEDWHRRYMFVIPVVAIGERELELATRPTKLGRFLAEALDGATGGAALS
jgi:glutaredoxin